MPKSKNEANCALLRERMSRTRRQNAVALQERRARCREDILQCQPIYGTAINLREDGLSMFRQGEFTDVEISDRSSPLGFKYYDSIYS